MILRRWASLVEGRGVGDDGKRRENRPFDPSTQPLPSVPSRHNERIVPICLRAWIRQAWVHILLWSLLALVVLDFFLYISRITHQPTVLDSRSLCARHHLDHQLRFPPLASLALDLFCHLGNDCTFSTLVMPFVSVMFKFSSVQVRGIFFRTPNSNVAFGSREF
jgi:hypothetical protein